MPCDLWEKRKIQADEIFMAHSDAGDVSRPAVNEPCVVTYSGNPLTQHMITWIRWSYEGGDPGHAGGYSIRFAGRLVDIGDLPHEGMGFLPIFKVAERGERVVVTLAAAGAVIQGTLSVSHKELVHEV